MKNDQLAEPVQQRVRGRTVVMDAFDEVMFTFALRDAFPRVVIKEEVERRGRRSRYRVIDTIADCEDSSTPRIYVEFDEAVAASLSGGRKSRSKRRRQYLHFARSMWIYSGRGSERWAFTPPTLIEGLVGASYYPGDVAARRAVGKVWRILGRLTTNLPRDQYDENGNRLPRRPMGPDIWYGHHALEWCARKPRRMLNGNAWPTEDWALPDTEWFRDLYDRVIATYGDRLDDPGPPEPMDPDEPRTAFRIW